MAGNKHTRAERAAAVARARGQREPVMLGGLPSEKLNRQQQRAQLRRARKAVVERRVAREQRRI